jgi:hypothetical protein
MIANMTDASPEKEQAEEALKARREREADDEADDTIPSNMLTGDLSPPRALMHPLFDSGDHNEFSQEQRDNMARDLNHGSVMWLWSCGESTPQKGRVDSAYKGMYKDQLWKFNGFGND